MSAELIDGKKIALDIESELINKISKSNEIKLYPLEMTVKTSSKKLKKFITQILQK